MGTLANQVPGAINYCCFFDLFGENSLLPMNPRPSLSNLSGEVRACILAGGLSERMGMDKAALELGEISMMDRVRREVESAGLACSLVREDTVARCGPIGGVMTAFERWPETILVFLSCDMPFVSRELITRLVAVARVRGNVFLWHDGRAGFPFALTRLSLETVRRRHAEGAYSLQGLAREPGCERLESAAPERELFNVNTPADMVRARSML